jgi:3-hydroxybutyryl-CoA dehydrogenase
MSESIRQLFVAGAGNMGHGIAQVSIAAGIDVTLYDIADDVLGKARDRIAWSLNKLHEKGKLAESPDDVLARLITTTSLDGAAAAQQVTEVVPERAAIKHELFAKLDDICPPQVIFTTNTSAIPIGTLATATKRADRFCGTHFFIPVPLMPLVEIIRGPQSSDATLAAASAWARQIGKTPVAVEKDVAGFIVNRVLMAAMIEAVELLEAGVASADDIDRAMQLGCNWRMGPLQTADLAGLDIVMHTLEAIRSGTPHEKFATPPLLAKLVEKNQLGRKTGKGFYDHTESPA